MGGLIEYQHNNNPHFHGNLHLVSIYQHCTLMEIRAKIEEGLLLPDTIHKHKEWVTREEHFDAERHYSQLSHLEKEGSANNRSAEHDPLCQMPAYVTGDSAATIWCEEAAVTAEDAVRNAESYKETYAADAQFIVSRTHHHWEPKDVRGERQPNNACRKKGRCNTT